MMYWIAEALPLFHSDVVRRAEGEMDRFMKSHRYELDLLENRVFARIVFSHVCVIVGYDA